MEVLPLSSYTERESELRKTLTDVCNANNIKLKVNTLSFNLNSPAAIDIEHDEEGNLVGIGVFDGIHSYYFTYVPQWDLSQVLFIAHNGKSDFEQLRAWGIPLSDSQLIWDTCLIGHIIDSSLKTYGLKDMARRDLSIEYPSYSDIVGKPKAKVRRTLDKWPVEITSKYNALDCFVTYKLFEAQSRAVRPVGTTGNRNQSAESQYFNTLEKPASYVFQNMETRGIRVDLKYLNDLKANLERQKAPIEIQIKNQLGNINLNSPKQLLGALNAKGIRPQLKGKYSTDKRALQSFAENPIVSNLLKFSELDTLLSSFVYPYLERNTEVVHPFFNQCGTRTGRPSCSNPNLLQIPRRTDNGKLVRRMFIPREGMLMGDCDFGQIEPRVLAHLSKDPVMSKMFNDGINFHSFTQERLKLGGTIGDKDSIGYNKAKVLNLSVGYRATFKSVQAQLGGTKDEAQEQINNWWELFPTLRRWQDVLIHDSKRSGFCTTLLGRRIKVDGLTEGNSWKREAAERQLINNITQGSASEIMKRAMILIQKGQQCGEFSPSFGLLVQVYDELLAESENMEEDIKQMKWCMQNSVPLDVPLTVDCKTGINWAECH